MGAGGHNYYIDANRLSAELLEIVTGSQDPFDVPILITEEIGKRLQCQVKWMMMEMRLHACHMIFWHSSCLYIENGSVYTSKMDQSKARTTYTILTQRATTPYCKGRAIDREAHGNNNV